MSSNCDSTCGAESYDSFFARKGLEDTLRNLGVDTLFITGSGLENIVTHTAMDAKELGYTTIIIRDATRENSQTRMSHTIGPIP